MCAFALNVERGCFVLCMLCIVSCAATSVLCKPVPGQIVCSLYPSGSNFLPGIFNLFARCNI